MIEGATILFGGFMENGIWADNSHVPLSLRLKGLTIGLQRMNECGIVAFQGKFVTN